MTEGTDKTYGHHQYIIVVYTIWQNGNKLSIHPWVWLNRVAMQSYWQHDWETSQISAIPIALCVCWMIINVIKCKNNTSLCTSSSPPQAPLVFELVPLKLAILFGVWGGLKYTKEKEIHTVIMRLYLFSKCMLIQPHFYLKTLFILYYYLFQMIVMNYALNPPEYCHFKLNPTITLHYFKKNITRAYEGCSVNTFQSMLKIPISSKC